MVTTLQRMLPSFFAVYMLRCKFKYSLPVFSISRFLIGKSARRSENAAQ